MRLNKLITVLLELQKIHPEAETNINALTYTDDEEIVTLHQLGVKKK